MPWARLTSPADCIQFRNLQTNLRKTLDTTRHLRKAANDEKALAYEMARLTRAERTHRLCTRGGMLETFIGEPSLLTDNDVMELLTFLFHSETTQKKLELLIARRRETAGQETC